MSGCSELARAFLDETFTESPVLASQLGVDGFDDQLDDLSESAIEQRRRRSQDWLRRFEELTDADCGSFDERIDRDLILSLLRGRAILDDWQMWRRQPDLYLGPGLGGVFTLLLHRLKPEPHIAQAVVCRLRQVPRVLDDARRNIAPDLAPSVYVERAMRQARAGARYARELLPSELADESLRADVAEAGAIAGDAMDAYATWLEELLPRALLRGLNADHPPTPESMRQSYAKETERETVPARAQPGHLPARRRVRGRAITAVSAAGPGGRLVQQPTAVFNCHARTLLRAIPA